MQLNYDRIILGKDVPIQEDVVLHVPTISELIEANNNDFKVHSQLFVTSVREQFSGVPEQVDTIEEQYPTFWDMAFDDGMNQAVGEVMFGKGITLQEQFVRGFAYWTRTNSDDYRCLSNKKIVSEKLNWIIDINTFEEFSACIKMITLYKQDHDLIAPKGVSSNPRKIQMWKNMYEGRIAHAKKSKTMTLGDRILLLEAFAPSFVRFVEIGELTYYQFANLLNTYMARYETDREYMVYTSMKFDTKNMQLKDLTDRVGLIKVNQDKNNKK